MTSDPLAGFFNSAAGKAFLDRIRMLEGSRVLVAVAGAPGSGKSTFSAGLVSNLPDAVLVPMDGFHLDDRILNARGLRDRKGAAHTFDAEGFVHLVRRLANPAGEAFFPIFDRDREIAVAGAGAVLPHHRIVVIEGNYLLLNLDPWVSLRFDLTVWLDVAYVELERRLTARWQGLGKDNDQIAAHLRNDLANARFAIENSKAADLSVSQAQHQHPGKG